MSERKMEISRSGLIKEKTDPSVVGSRIIRFFLSSWLISGQKATEAKEQWKELKATYQEHVEDITSSLTLVLSKVEETQEKRSQLQEALELLQAKVRPGEMGVGTKNNWTGRGKKCGVGTFGSCSKFNQKNTLFGILQKQVAMEKYREAQKQWRLKQVGFYIAVCPCTFARILFSA